VAAIFVTRAQADRTVFSFCAEQPKQFNPPPAGPSQSCSKTIITLMKDKNKKRWEWRCPPQRSRPLNGAAGGKQAPRPPEMQSGRMTVTDGFFARRVLAHLRDGKVHFGEAFAILRNHSIFDF